jgi:hypothetical protein
MAMAMVLATLLLAGCGGRKAANPTVVQDNSGTVFTNNTSSQIVFVPMSTVSVTPLKVAKSPIMNDQAAPRMQSSPLSVVTLSSTVDYFTVKEIKVGFKGLSSDLGWGNIKNVRLTYGTSDITLQENSVTIDGDQLSIPLPQDNVLPKGAKTVVTISGIVASGEIGGKFTTTIQVVGEVNGQPFNTVPIEGQAITISEERIGVNYQWNANDNLATFGAIALDAADFDFVTYDKPTTIRAIGVRVDNSDLVEKVSLMVDSAVIGNAVIANGVANFTDLNIPIPAYSHKMVKVVIDLKPATADTEGRSYVNVSLDTYSAFMDEMTRDYTSWVGNSTVIGRSVPVLSQPVPATSILTAGQLNLLQIGLFANGEAFNWRKMVFTVKGTRNVQVSGFVLKDADMATVPADISTDVHTDSAGIQTTRVTVQALADQPMGAYTLTGEVSGPLVPGDYLVVSIEKQSEWERYGTSYADIPEDASFVWKDASGNYYNDYFIKGLPLTRTLAK